MILQSRDIEVLTYLARYFILSTRQIRELAFPDDTTGRITRRRLNKMVAAEFLRKRRMQVVHPDDGSVTPVYHLTKLGREFLAGHLDDDTYLWKPVEPSQPQHLFHYLAVSETHRLFDRALKAHSEVRVPKWVNEDESVNPEEPDRAKRLQLGTKFDSGSKVICLPDAGFLLEYRDHRVVVYLEQDRDTFFHDRVAARKSPGYRQLSTVRGHRKHFPETTLDFFFVLFVAPTRKRADQLRRAFAKKNHDQKVSKVYRFAAFEELNEENLFFDAMLSCCHHGERVPLIKRLE